MKSNTQLNRDALFSDGTNQYRKPNEPMPYEKVSVRLRTLKDNVDQALLVVGEEAVSMVKVESDGHFDYYGASFSLKTEKVEYYFQVKRGDAVCYYSNKGVSDTVLPYYSFFVTPGFKTPDWAKGAVFYQIFVDRFCNGDTANDVLDRDYYYVGKTATKATDWVRPPASHGGGVSEFY